MRNKKIFKWNDEYNLKRKGQYIYMLDSDGKMIDGMMCDSRKEAKVQFKERT